MQYTLLYSTVQRCTFHSAAIADGLVAGLEAFSGLSTTAPLQCGAPLKCCHREDHRTAGNRLGSTRLRRQGGGEGGGGVRVDMVLSGEGDRSAAGWLLAPGSPL